MTRNSTQQAGCTRRPTAARDPQRYEIKTMNSYRPGIKNVLRENVILTAVSLSLILLTACAPMTVTYYRPDSASGKVVKAWCPPVHSFILIETHDVIVGFKVSSPLKDRMLVTITFEIPEKHNVQIVDRFVEIHGITGVSSKGELSGHTWVAAGRTAEIPLDMPMQGSTKKRVFDQTTLYGKTNHAYFFLRADIAAVRSERFSLKPPMFSVDGIQVDLPVINFVRTKETFVGSLNC
jgi:hypothetical protein